MAAPSSKKTSKSPTFKDGQIRSNMLFVSGLPYTTTNEELGKLFSNIGPVKKCFVVKNIDSSTNRGFGYVKFSLFKDAERAIAEVQKIGTRRVTLTFADSAKKVRQTRRPRAQVLGDALLENDEGPDTDRPASRVAPDQESNIPDRASGDGAKKIENKKTKPSLNKARLIIRNLNFACDAITLQSKFQMFGRICDIRLPKKTSTGQAMGVGFVQYKKLKAASRAIAEMNGTKIMGRVVAVDWVVDKDTLKSATDEQDDGSDGGDQRSDDDENDEGDEDEDDDADDDVDEESDERDEDSDDEGFDEDDDKDDEEISEAKKRKLDNSQPQRDSDVKQGRTLFIRNLPFDAQEDELTDMLSEFGETNYCLLVRDRDTGMCKGSAFVQFASKDHAENCLKKSNTEEECLMLNGRKLNVVMAMERKSVADTRAVKRDREKTDKRNIHLLREGMIRDGTQSATELTKTDLILRNKIEAQMKIKLKNPAVFISPTRVVVNNLPYNVDDAKLKQAMVTAAGGRGVKVTECRVMRHLSQVKAGGVARSMGYAFVDFSNHDHAMTALHSVNNAELFSQNKKLIVHFSLENRNALEFKRQRQLRAAMKHDSSKQKRATDASSKEAENLERRREKGRQSRASVVPLVPSKKPKPKNMFPSHVGPKVRHKARESQKKGKQRGPVKPGGTKQRPTVVATPAVANKRKRHSRPKTEIRDTFDSLVLKYKKQLTKNIN